MLIRLNNLNASVDFTEAMTLKSSIRINKPDTLREVLMTDCICNFG